VDFYDVVLTQRSTRRFKRDPVPEETLRRILEAAVRAPSGSNEQPWVWLVVRDEATRDALAEAVLSRYSSSGALDSMLAQSESGDSAAVRRRMADVHHFFSDVSEAPVLVVPCLYRITSPTTDPSTLLAGTSIYGAVQNLMLAARAEGLGSVLTTFQASVESELRELLELPDDAVPACIVPIGWPADGERFGGTRRKPLDEVVFWDAWGRAPTPA
jgi:nitroreductase